MSEPFHEFYWRRADPLQPAIRVALVLSLLIHALAFWRIPLDVRTPSFEMDGRDERQLLTVRIAPPPSPPAAPSVLSVPREAPRAPAVPQPPVPKPVPRASPERQPVIALAKPTPEAPAAPQPPAATPQPPARPPAGDLSSYIEARRQARGDPAPPSVESAARAPSAEDENQRANRIAAANVGADRRPSFGTDPSRSGGMFSIQRLTLDYAEFLFYGWNRDINRNTSQLIEVRRGDAPDIRIAVVRRMIAIIRQYEQEDFLWESRRLGRYITLSARQRDNAGLEEFMMREFFEAETRLR